LHRENAFIVKAVFTKEGTPSQPMSRDFCGCAWITAFPEPSTEALASRSTRQRFCHLIPGVFTPVLAKHSKSFSLIDRIAVGVDRMQPNFEPMRKQVEAWQRSELTDVTAKVVIYEAFRRRQIGGSEAPGAHRA
jgi:hypothetical protein